MDNQSFLLFKIMSNNLIIMKKTENYGENT